MRKKIYETIAKNLVNGNNYSMLNKLFNKMYFIKKK